jgi:orotate phosphoribosyltransferase
MDVRAELQKVGSIYEGHFVGVSTKHLAGYCNIDPLLTHVSLVSKLIEELVNNFTDLGVEVVASPAVGAIPFCHWGAHHMMAKTGTEIAGVWADKVSGSAEREFTFERQGFAEAVKGKKVLILEDIVNQMISIKAMIKTVQDAGGIIVGVGAIAAQPHATAEELGVPQFVKLCEINYDVWTAEDCAVSGLCAKGDPIVEDIGHGDDFKKNHPDYAGGYVKLLA